MPKDLSTVEVDGATSMAATSGTDFGALSNEAVTFPAGEATTSLEITIEEDSTPEYVETFQVIVRSDTSGGLVNIDPNRRTTNITILDDDSMSYVHRCFMAFTVK